VCVFFSRPPRDGFGWRAVGAGGRAGTGLEESATPPCIYMYIQAYARILFRLYTIIIIIIKQSAYHTACAAVAAAAAAFSIVI